MSSRFASLQHAEALARYDLLTVEAYDVTLDLAAGEETFRSVTRIRLTSRGGPTFLDLKPASLREVTLDGTPLPVDRLERGRFPLDLPPGEHEIGVDAEMPFRHDGEGLHAHTDPADGRRYVYGMSFMDAAPTIFACFDQPDLKAPYTFHVRAPREWTVVGNAPLETTEDAGTTRWWHLQPSQPLSTYFVTLVAGPYHRLADEHDGIRLGLSARASLAADLEKDAEELLTVTKQCFDEFHRLFGIRYPFGDYHQAFVPEFNAGAMENPGCVTFRDPLVFTSRVSRSSRIGRATTVAHEMAHQWFGNIVTPKWWDDLWLNESFAEYLGNRVTADVTEYADAWADNAHARRLWGLSADLGPGTHPVAGNGAVDASAALQDFDGISYAKGSSILKQLATTLGDDVFFGGVADHLERHRFGNATMHDLFAAWERAGAHDLGPVVEQWLRTAGPDTIELDREAGVIRRTPPPDRPADRTHTFRIAHLADGSASTVTLSGPETPVAVPDGPVLLDAWEDTWAVTLPDTATVAALPEVLPAVTDPMVRASVWNSLRAAIHVNAIDPAAVVEVAVAAFPVDDAADGPPRAVPHRTLPWLARTIVPLAPAGAADRLLAAARLSLASLTEKHPGSDPQLAAFRAVLSLDDDAEELRSWLTVPPQGIEPDPDVRWRILTRLAVLGAVDRAELDAVLESDPSATATVDHTRAVASLPDPEAKEWAWRRFTGTDEASNYQVDAAGVGFWQPGQADLVAPYVDDYFDALPRLPEVHHGWLLADVVKAFFPRSVLDGAVVHRADAMLADGALEATVRRPLAEATDQLRRMLAVRAAHPHR